MDDIRTTAAGLMKQADPLREIIGQQSYSAANSDIAKMLLAGLGVGVAGRGAMGLYNLVRRETEGGIRPGTGSVTATIPVPANDTEENLEEAKFAADAPFMGWPRGKTEVPYYMPGVVLGGMGGLYGGWKALDVLLDKRRRAAQDDELTDAQSDFEAAILESQQRKVAADGSTLGQQLDDLFDKTMKAAAETGDRLEKQADIGDTLGGWGRYGTGLYAAYAAPTALLTGIWAYQKAKKNQNRSILDKALKKRQQQQQQQDRVPVFAETRPTRPAAPKPEPPKNPDVDLEVQPEEETSTPRRRITRL